MKGRIAVLFMFLLAACNQQSDVDAGNDTMETEIVVQEPATPDFSRHFPELSNYLQAQDSSFTMQSFTQGEVISRDTTAPLPVDQNDLLPYQPYLVYNSDSSMALDLVSYNFIETTKRGKKQLEFAGPDSEAGLIDVKNGNRRRILFMGSAGVIFDGKWENDQTILIAGAEESSDGRLRPFMWRYHLQTSELEVFSFPGTIDAKAGDYFERKYNNKNLRTTLTV